MNELKNIIRENIEYFWNNDPVVWCEGGVFKEKPIIINDNNIEFLWDAFKLWCIPNCMESFKDIDKSIIEAEVNAFFDEWRNYR